MLTVEPGRRGAARRDAAARSKMASLAARSRGGPMSNAAEPASAPSVADVPIAELARQQGVGPVGSVDELARPSSWESDAEFEDFLTDLHQSRHADLS